MIKKLDDKTILKIKSDITIPNLSSVIKELFENSLDAGATKIEISLKGNGFKSITVEDDGKGIPAENRENICHRYYTSKIQDLDDGVETFGFRGEALNSLCRDCGSVEIWTKTEDEVCGVLLNYDTEGDLMKSTPAQSEHAMDIFQSQLNKIIEILEEYSLILYKTRIILKLDTKKDPILSKPAFQDILGTVSHVFDPRVAKCFESIEYEGEYGKIEIFCPQKGTVHRPDVLSICIIDIDKHKFELADSNKRTIYLDQKDEILSKINQLMEKNFGSERSDGTNIRNFDQQNPSTPSPKKYETRTLTTMSPPKPTSPTTLENGSKTQNNSPSNIQESPRKTIEYSNQSKSSSYQESPLLAKLLNRKPALDSDSDDDELVEFQPSQNSSAVDIKGERFQTPKKPSPSVSTLHDSPSENLMRFSRHYMNRTNSNYETTPIIEQTSSIPETKINNRLSDPIFEQDYLNESRIIFSQDQVTPSFSQDQLISRLFNTPPKDSSPLKRKNTTPSPQEEKRKKYEEEKKAQQMEEVEKNNEIYVEIKPDDILNGFLKSKECQRNESSYTNLTKREESKLEDFFSLDKSSLKHTKILGNFTLENEKEVVLLQYGNHRVSDKELISFFAFDPIYVDKNLKYYNLMQTHQVPCVPLEEPVNLSNHPKLSSIHKRLLKNPYLNYVFKVNGFYIEDMMLTGLVSREIIPAYGIDDLIDLLNNLSFFETQLYVINNEEEKLTMIKRNLGYLRNTKVKNYLRKKSKEIINDSLTASENELQLKKLSECEAITEFSTRTMFVHLNSLKKV